jgi:hypothetical protein
MTDEPTRRQLHIERRVAAERHRQLEVGSQTSDARAALAAVKLERETTEGTGETRFRGLRTKRSLSGATTKSILKRNARRAKRFPLASPLGYRKSGNRTSGVEFTLFLTVVNLRPRDSVVRSLDDPPLRICMSRSSLEI